MAKTTTLVDDMTGEAGAAERRFSIGGVDYVIDLTEDTYQALLRTMEPWRSLARIDRKQRRLPYPPLTKETRVKIRKWAEATGRPLAARGRFPTDLVKSFYEENADEWDLIQREATNA